MINSDDIKHKILMDDIRAKIKAIDKCLSEKILDLIYQYVLERLKDEYSFETMMQNLKNDHEFSRKLNETILAKEVHKERL